MKSVLFAVVLASSLVVSAAPTSSATRTTLPAAAAATTQGQISNQPLFVKNSIYTASLSTNVLAMTQSRPNVGINILLTDRVAAALSYASQSEVEPRKHLGNQRVTVDRANLGIGAAIYAREISAQQNLMVAPQLIFGNEKDVARTDTTNGIGLKAAALIRASERVLVEMGLTGTNISGDTKGELHAGLGVLF